MLRVCALAQWAVFATVTTTTAAPALPPVERRAGEERELEIAKGVLMKFCWIPEGETQVGSPKEEQDYVTKTFFEGKRLNLLDAEMEEVRGRFKTTGFWLGKYEVTEEQWNVLMGEHPFSFGYKQCPKLPSESVCWYACAEFANKLSEKWGLSSRYELSDIKRSRYGVITDAVGKVNNESHGVRPPHEDEWEYACRAGRGNKRPFYWGDSFDSDHANFNGKFPWDLSKAVVLSEPTVVGSYESKAKHPWNLCDMHGNVYEWCDNLYSKETTKRVLRGGSWNANSWGCRAPLHFVIPPHDRLEDFGFRVCLALD